MNYRTLILSDLHIGNPLSGYERTLEFVTANTFDKIIINGDLIDFWYVTEFGGALPDYDEIIYKMIRRTAEIVYVCGNHDHQMCGMRTKYAMPASREYIHVDVKGRELLVTHGDRFYTLTSKIRWVNRMVGRLYRLSIRIKNVLRLDPRFTQMAKSMVMGNTISNFKRKAISHAREYGLDGIVCGHIHRPGIDSSGDVLYMNCGDSVESMTVLVEDYTGEWSIVGV